jgi:tRNA U55 pseudouridine synthase TruB
MYKIYSINPDGSSAEGFSWPSGQRTSGSNAVALAGRLLSVETALDDIPALAVTEVEAASLRHGRSVTSADQAFCRGLGEGTTIRAVNGDRLVAFAQIRDGGLRPINNHFVWLFCTIQLAEVLIRRVTA